MMSMQAPAIGEIKQGGEIGKNGEKRPYVWAACTDCDKGRWVTWVDIRKCGGKPISAKCQVCANRLNLKKAHKVLRATKGILSRQWKGGRWISPLGYTLVYVNEDSPYFPMVTHRRHVLEHRLVMAEHLGRCLKSEEVIHHKNGIKDDNRLENLQLVTSGTHEGKVVCPFCEREFAIP